MHTVQLRGQQWHLSGISVLTVLSVFCHGSPRVLHEIAASQLLKTAVN